MAECKYCKYTGGAHSLVSCPEAKSGKERLQLIEVWKDGYKQGRSGGENTYDTDPTYTLGWLNGLVALEEAENGHDPNCDQDEDFSPDDYITQDLPIYN